MPKKETRNFETKTVRKKGLLNRLRRKTQVLQRYEGDDTWTVRSDNGR